MPDGLDPDEIVERDREEWKRLVTAAKPIVEHVLDTLMADKNVNDPKVKAEIVAQVLPLIEDLPNPVERDSYRQMLARRLRVDERALTSKLATVSPSRRYPAAVRGRRPTQEPVQEQKPAEAASLAARPRKLEAACLGILLRRPDLLPRLDRRLQESGLGALTLTDFEYTDHQLILRLLQQALEQDESETPRFVEAHLGDDLLETFRSLVGSTFPGSSDDKLLDEATRQVRMLRQRRCNERLTQLSFLIEEEKDAAQLMEYNKMVSQYRRLRSALDVLQQKMSAYHRG
jgi:DNA primase